MSDEVENIKEIDISELIERETVRLRAEVDADILRDRRERIATAVLAGRCAYKGFGSDADWPTAARLAVGLADALIAALDAEAGDGTR